MRGDYKTSVRLPRTCADPERESRAWVAFVASYGDGIAWGPCGICEHVTDPEVSEEGKP